MLTSLRDETKEHLIKYVKEFGFKGLELHPKLHNFHIMDISVLELVKTAGDPKDTCFN